MYRASEKRKNWFAPSSGTNNGFGKETTRHLDWRMHYSRKLMVVIWMDNRTCIVTFNIDSCYRLHQWVQLSSCHVDKAIKGLK